MKSASTDDDVAAFLNKASAQPQPQPHKPGLLKMPPGKTPRQMMRRMSVLAIIGLAIVLMILLGNMPPPRPEEVRAREDAKEVETWRSTLKTAVWACMDELGVEAARALPCAYRKMERWGMKPPTEAARRIHDASEQKVHDAYQNAKKLYAPLNQSTAPTKSSRP